MAFMPDLSKSYPFLPFVFFLSVYLPQRNSCYVLGDKCLHKTRERKKTKGEYEGKNARQSTLRCARAWSWHEIDSLKVKTQRGTHQCLLKKKMKTIRVKVECREKEEEKIEELRGERQTWNMISRIGMERMRKTGSGEEGGGEQDRK